MPTLDGLRWSTRWPPSSLLLPAVLALLIGAAGCGAGLRNEAAGRQVAPAGEQEWSRADEFGIEPLSLRRAAQGNLLDFRYRIVDPERARSLFERGLEPELFEPASGLRLGVPRMAKVGPLKSYGNLGRGRIHYILFANPGARIKAGAHVALVVGQMRLKSLVVE